jgi:hypothetical protein
LSVVGSTVPGMTTLKNRPNTALLVVDVQNGVVDDVDEGLVRGSEEWRIVPELKPDDAEPLAEKSYGDAFEVTTLESVLSASAPSPDGGNGGDEGGGLRRGIAIRWCCPARLIPGP